MYYVTRPLLYMSAAIACSRALAPERAGFGPSSFSHGSGRPALTQRVELRRGSEATLAQGSVCVTGRDVGQ